jgi:hypothetical protein
MKSDVFKVGNFNVAHKDGYYLISENKVSEKGKAYESDTKTFPNLGSAFDYLDSKNCHVNEIVSALDFARDDYELKTSQAHISQMEKAKAAKLKKELKK